MQLAVFINEPFVHRNAYDVRDEHIVAAERQDVRHPAFQRNRAFGHRGRTYLCRRRYSEVADFKFLYIPTAFHAAEIDDANQIRTRQIDDELARLLDERI